VSINRHEAIEADLRASLARSESDRIKMQRAQMNQPFFRSKTFAFVAGFFTAGAAVWLSTRINK
jgi:hypothetical protein